MLASRCTLVRTIILTLLLVLAGAAATGRVVASDPTVSDPNVRVTGYLWRVVYSNCCGSTSAFVIAASPKDVDAPGEWPEDTSSLLTEAAIYQGKATSIIVDGKFTGRVQADGSFVVEGVGAGVHQLQIVDEGMGGGLSRPAEFTVSPGNSVLDVRMLIEIPWLKRFGVMKF